MTIPVSLIEEATRWRKSLHAHPELGYQEQQTSQWVAEQLATMGLQVHRGLAGTGVVGTLENGHGPTIGLRADMDALPITELGEQPHRSTAPGVMHACGHDGHTAILLATAKHLSTTRHFSGTLHFVFQPAEENLGGARRMVDEGLFTLFPMDAIYAMHNWPGLPVGDVAVNEGPMMASLDSFEITLRGRSCHAAMPENGADPIVAAAQLIMALQTIPSRRLSPLASAVISITQINGGEAINVIPEKVVLRGTLRCLQTDVRSRVRQMIEELVTSFTAPLGIEGHIEYLGDYPVTMNHAQEAGQVRRCALTLLPAEKVHWNVNPSMASEDFACMLEHCPGAYFWLGADGETPSRPLHNAYYDFNDTLIAPGITFWTALVQQLLPQS